MSSPAAMETGSGNREDRSSGMESISGLPPRYRPSPLQRPTAASSSKSTSFYREGTRRVCFLDFSGVASSKTVVYPRLYDLQPSTGQFIPCMASRLKAAVSANTGTGSGSPTESRQLLPARPRYTSEEEDWIMNFVNQNPEKSWQHVTDGFNLAFNQQRTLKGMQIKGYSLFESKAKNGALSMPTGLRQLRKKEELAEENKGNREVEEEEDEDEEEEDDESEQENMIASVGKRYTNLQEDWLLSYVANNAKSGSRKDWVGTAAAFAAKFGLQRAPMSLNNKWTHLSRQSSSSIFLVQGQDDHNTEEGRREIAEHRHRGEAGGAENYQEHRTYKYGGGDKTQEYEESEIL